MSTEAFSIEGAGGITLVAEAHGDIRGMPVLLAHGGGQTRRAWKRVMGDLAQAGFRAIAFDMRGHGASEWSKTGAYDIRDFAADLIAAAASMEVKPALVGASLGGLAGLMAEGDLAPGTFASLTLVDIAPRMEPGGVARVVGFMEEHVDSGFGSPEEAADVISRYLPHSSNRGGGSGLKSYLRQKADGRYYWHWDPAFIRNITVSRGESAHRQLQQIDVLGQAAAHLTLPLHLIRGASSDLVSLEAVAHLRQLVPHAEYTDIADATHMVVGDANDAFSAAIVEFLRRHHSSDTTQMQGTSEK
ncbi:peroxidase [Tsuneonella deserti]|jgi:pimeloyl-ACP methyl ester carboxylesterase|uniref:Peroxidase n=1 Tax=Tsuneonella deserti TaxID=2035528 RepID=A0ABQ1RYT6_9SPHN|nr:alpha/beta hydrolase [Tsuneonella deserti]GGD86921.1 peroxidase [Tsuneonella deserti]